MKKLICILFVTLCTSALWPGNYRSFKVSVYTRAYEVEKMKDLQWLDSTWNIISGQVKVDKIYLETHRDLLIVPDATLEQAKRYFKEKGVEVGGGITYTINEANSFETFCYSNPEHRKTVREIAEHTARHFDDFILDDFFFTSCKSDDEIKAKGDRSWTEYRLQLMTQAASELILRPARKVNPNVKVIIKYPNWYDHFQGLGFDLEHGPKQFDAVWTGTETRDPGSAQHLQNYLSYNIVRYFDNLRPGYNLGGWVDAGGSQMGMDRYAEQLWLTMFAKAPEMNLFAYHQLIGVKLNPAMHRKSWQGQGTSFDYDEMMKPVALNGGAEVVPSTMARVAGVVFEQIDKFVYKLGNPIGIKSYKPFHSEEEGFLQNYLGMIGLPMDMVPQFPKDRKVVLLTEQAAADAGILAHIKNQLQKGGDIVITSGLLKAIPEQIAQIAELHCSDLKALVDDMGRHGKLEREILIPQVGYYTNDAWEMVSAGRPLRGGVSGYPILLRAPYSKGNMYVLTIPDDMGNLYDYPEEALNAIRRVLSQDLDIRLNAPSKVALMVYDNGTFIVESFRDEPVTVTITAKGEISALKDLVNDKSVQYLDGKSDYQITLMPHSYKVFQIETK
ncbi:hypothetical protein [Bacteroides sp. UBA939]|uniref:hypothetical protein n=1 Tax=Bacteroides sp. UBA939 TaxID=1946092 RepID=UPI0025B87C1F|nr:hypothetical protein [Bacteroides sp. UBA939]